MKKQEKFWKYSSRGRKVCRSRGRPRLATWPWPPEPAPNSVWSWGWPPSFTTRAYGSHTLQYYSYATCANL